MTIFLTLSFSLLLASLIIFSRSKFSYTGLVFYSFIFICTLCLSVFFIISNSFTGEGITESVIYHLQAGIGGAGFSAYSQLIAYTVILSILLLISLCFVSIRALHNSHQKVSYTYVSITVIALAFLCNPAVHNIHTVFFSPQIQLTLQTIATKSQIPIVKAADPYTFRANYIPPTIHKKQTPKNLVLIYAEGLEYTYSNTSSFPGLTPYLTALESKATTFTNIEQVYGTGFTIAGMVASQCGLPLVSASHGNSLHGMDRFLPGATCLGDLLAKEKYYLSYHGGADLTFAGKGKFYKSHGFHEVKGKKELLPLLEDPTYVSGWGLYDDTLFDITYDRFLELSSSTEKFALTMLTLDTHHPGGFPSKSCDGILYEDGKNQLLNTVACSDKLISEFIEKILSSEYGQNTTVVLVSDHLTMNPEKRLKELDRSNRFMIFDGANLTQTVHTMEGSSYDISPTILPHIGYTGHLALGRNLADPKVQPVDIARIHNSVRSWKKDILSFWEYPKLTSALTITVEHPQIIMDGRIFKFPALIGFEKDLSAGMLFRFNMNEYSLLAQISTLQPDMGFVLIEECALITSFYDQTLATLAVAVPTESKYCLATGSQTITNIFPLTENKTLLREEVRELTGLDK